MTLGISNFIMLSVAFFIVMLNAIMLSVVILCVIMLNVAAPVKKFYEKWWIQTHDLGM
jgi:hypothetical protein